MKKLTLLGVLVVVSSTVSFADSGGNTIARPASSKNELVMHDVTGFTNPYTGPGTTKESVERAPDLHPNLEVRPGGVTTDIVKYGPVMISPAAPASYGMGERYLTAPDPQYDLPHESGQAAHRDSGGIKVFSIEF